MNQTGFCKFLVMICICAMGVSFLTGCSGSSGTQAEDLTSALTGEEVESQKEDEAPLSEEVDQEETEAGLASVWTVGTLANDYETGILWNDYGYMNGSNVKCQSDGSVIIYVDEDGSEDYEGNFMPSEAAGIIFPLDSYETIVGNTYEVELEIPAAYPTFNDGVAVVQTLGIFEKNPERASQLQGVFVNYGYCPGGDNYISKGGHHYSFGGIMPDGITNEVIMDSTGVFMDFYPLDRDLIRQTVTIKLDIKESSIEFSTNGQAPYHIIDTSPKGIGDDFEFRIMTHAGNVNFGTYDPAGAPYNTNIKSVKINGEEIPLCSGEL